MVDASCIFGELKHQKPECSNLAENAWCAYKGAQMLCAGLASFCTTTAPFNPQRRQTQIHYGSSVGSDFEPEALRPQSPAFTFGYYGI
ncbi:hypothetical protein AVEN_255354-1 [Araneus ventricosus]|uniref:Uncharacterized protein n=1 Tax=Araneus ventricosus TaxID=182803 RepID=A0A4Y2U9F1_ARAVE|nr:hypothetical protein AVEN_255354-1 [Araneus ventricosus]